MKLICFTFTLFMLLGCQSETIEVSEVEPPESQENVNEAKITDEPMETSSSGSESASQSVKELLTSANAMVMPNANGGLRSVIFEEETVSTQALEAILKSTEIEILSMSGTTVGNAEVQKIANLPNLKVLLLGGTKVTDEGLVHLNSLSNLQRLGLGETQITDEGLKHLEGLSNLTVLGIGDTKVTDAGVKAFQTAVPKCEVRR